ncbi:LacI family DNA-binding transcriptional regulator [Martelella limonii]|uniref:LacI family DNA-binding transcriptional regulator n=1 Tax=Martelella limonii TaxID=1647649 RepID=UPI0015801F23|nr:LacI family DNA-binding transcriptional regulator [Martelella limonii]
MEKNARASRITIRTVAADAGVSVAAVSKVLRNAYGVSDALRENVTRSIEKLGYRPSTAARGMRGRTFSVGVLLIDMENPFLPKLVGGFKRKMAEAGYNTLIGVGEARTHVESALIESMIDMRIDGLLLVAPRIAGKGLDQFARQTPITVVGHHEPDAINFDTANVDDREGGRLATVALLKKGYRDIAMISPTTVHRRPGDVWHEREAGYRAALSQAGLSHVARLIDISERPDEMVKQINTMLDRSDVPEAIFCWSDIHGVPLINMARKRGLSVPGDLALISFDNSPPAALPLIELASIDQAPAHLGSIAASQLLSRIEGRTESSHQMVAPVFADRASY